MYPHRWLPNDSWHHPSLVSFDFDSHYINPLSAVHLSRDVGGGLGDLAKKKRGCSYDFMWVGLVMWLWKPKLPISVAQINFFIIIFFSNKYLVFFAFWYIYIMVYPNQSSLFRKNEKISLKQLTLWTCVLGSMRKVHEYIPPVSN